MFEVAVRFCLAKRPAWEQFRKWNGTVSALFRVEAWYKFELDWCRYRDVSERASEVVHGLGRLVSGFEKDVESLGKGFEKGWD